jgi:hypothetical protein
VITDITTTGNNAGEGAKPSNMILYIPNTYKYARPKFINLSPS